MFSLETAAQRCSSLYYSELLNEHGNVRDVNIRIGTFFNKQVVSYNSEGTIQIKSGESPLSKHIRSIEEVKLFAASGLAFSSEALVCAGGCGQRYNLLSLGIVNDASDIVKLHDSQHPNCDRQKLQKEAEKHIPIHTFTEADYSSEFHPDNSQNPVLVHVIDDW
ncbi:hypothetical protein [uncultured Endozoicomonas sp.]|uniref:hypothetical protein n=1 Tax=uncultured Endozoicomonas sp. TaxID=432652 RepID=UPI0026258CCA|nr:hypothetical protein [uncultured Endozoicomonas sp.]